MKRAGGKGVAPAGRLESCGVPLQERVYSLRICEFFRPDPWRRAWILFLCEKAIKEKQVCEGRILMGKKKERRKEMYNENRNQRRGVA